MKKSYFIILLLLLSPIFFIKSSNISLSENYIDFIVKSSNSIVIKNTAYSFSNKFTLNVSSSGYKESTFNFDHRDSEKIVVLDELPISVSIEVEPQTDPVVLIDGKIISDFNMVDLYKGTYELFITHRNFGRIFHNYGSQKQRAKIGELLLANSTTKIYDGYGPSQEICEIETLGHYQYKVDQLFFRAIKK